MKLTPAVKKQLAKIVGPQGVLTDELSLLLYAYDCAVSRTRPDCVVLINNPDHIAPVLRILQAHKIPFVPRASATNHAGSCAALAGGVILNLTALNHILEINTQEQFAVVQPGVVVADLQERLAPLGYFYAPDPASQQVCTIGGNVAQNASGARCLKYGGTLAHVLAADFVLADGTEVSVSSHQPGPDVIGLLCGSEGTLGVLTQLTLRILPKPVGVQTFLVTFPSLQDSIEAVSHLVAQGIVPRCVEALDKLTVQSIEDFVHAGYPTDGEALVILELDGPPAQVEKEAQHVQKICQQHHALHIHQAITEQERRNLWRGRRSAFAAMARLSPNVMVGDGTVPRSRLPVALKRVQQLVQESQFRAGLLFHAGDGNFHPHILFDQRNKFQTIQANLLLREILKVCVEEGGTLSGEHGIGVEKRALMAYEYDTSTLAAMARIKHTLDPQNLANPLKIFPHQFAEKARKPLPLPPAVRPLQERMLSYCQQQTPFMICGRNTHLQTKHKQLIGTRSLQQIIEIDTSNYTVTAQAGVCLETLAKCLKKAGVYSVLPNMKGTVGGAFCSGMFPAFYGYVTGIEALLPDGTYVRYGGKLMKNAAGYNLIHLLAGSQGTLGLVTQLTFKVFAHPVALQKPLTFKRGFSNLIWARLCQAFNPTSLLLNSPREQTHG